MAAGKHWEIHDDEQTKKMTPPITCEVSFGQRVCELFFGVNKFDLDCGVLQFNPIKQPIQRNSLGSGHVSHRRTSALYDHFGHSLTVFKNVHLIFELRRSCARDNVIHIGQFINFSVTVSFLIWCWGWCFGFHCVLDFSALDLIIDLFDSDLSLLDGCSLKKQYFYHHIPKIESWDSIHSQTSIHRKNFRFYGTVRHRCLLLAPLMVFGLSDHTRPTSNARTMGFPEVFSPSPYAGLTVH